MFQQFMYSFAALCFILLVHPQAAPAQLANGSIAPDFTLTDINGKTHRLYDYLAQNKTVIIDFFAAHCPSCWAYHNQHHIKTLYEKHGPMGSVSTDVIVMAIEHDPNNGIAELTGNGYSAGNWLATPSYPIINPEGADRKVLEDYKVIYYPMVYGICPDKKITLLGTRSADELYQYVQGCAVITGVEKSIHNPIPVSFRCSQSSHTILFPTNEQTLTLFNHNGQLIKTVAIGSDNNTIDMTAVATGIYYYQTGNSNVRGKFMIQN
jgi:hypothetical protein